MRFFKFSILVLFTLPLVACLDLWLSEEPEYKLSGLSPKGVFSIQIEKRRNEVSESDPWTWKAFLSFTREGKPVLNEVQVGAGDASTGGFPKQPQLSWVHENAFRLGDEGQWPEAECDVLLVNNGTTNSLSYLMVGGARREKFFILDLQPEFSVKLYAMPQWQRGDMSWIAASGRFSDGRSIDAGQNFIIHDSGRGPGHYCLTIKDDQITIRSREFEGWRQKPLTDEEWKQLKDIWKKEETGQATENDIEIKKKLWGEREEIITPRDERCGASGGSRQKPPPSKL